MLTAIWLCSSTIQNRAHDHRVVHDLVEDHGAISSGISNHQPREQRHDLGKQHGERGGTEQDRGCMKGCPPGQSGVQAGERFRIPQAPGDPRRLRRDREPFLLEEEGGGLRRRGRDVGSLSEGIPRSVVESGAEAPAFEEIRPRHACWIIPQPIRGPRVVPKRQLRGCLKPWLIRRSASKQQCPFRRRGTGPERW